MKRKNLDELQEKARQLTSEALRSYEIPDEIRQNIALGVLFDGDDRVFELYIPNEIPQNGTVITRVRINSYTGEPKGAVEVFLSKRKMI